MKLSNKLYDWIKNIGQVILPAILTFSSDIFAALGKDADVFVKIFASFIELYNIFVVVWNKIYNDQQKAQAEIVDYNEEQG